MDNVENPSPVWFLPNLYGRVTMHISLYNDNQTEFMVSAGSICQIGKKGTPNLAKVALEPGGF